jgi:hypothetical protein
MKPSSISVGRGRTGTGFGRGRARPRAAGRRAGILGAIASIVCLLFLTLGAAIARAGTNGRIAFELTPDISPSLATINPDGSAFAAMPGVPKLSANAAWSANGTQLAFSSAASGRSQIYVIREDGGNLAPVTQDPAAAIDPTWAPDGIRIAFASTRNGASDIYVVNLVTHVVTRLTTDPAVDQQPRWSPDGNLIAFASNRSGTFQIYTMSPDGSNQQAVTSQVGSNTDPAWSPRGSQLAFTDTSNGRTEVYAIARTGGASRQITNGDGTDELPAWSPDGQLIAFTRDGGIWTVSSNGETAGRPAQALYPFGDDPVWAPQLVPTAASVVGDVTVTPPGATAAMPLSTTAQLPSGSVVHAASAAVTIAFRPQAETVSVPPSTATVSNTSFSVVGRTATLLSLSLARRSCGRGAVTASPNRAVAAVRHGHYSIRTRQIIAASHETDYTVIYTCQGTRVTVTAGVVVATWQRGQHRSVPIRAGHSFFAKA